MIRPGSGQGAQIPQNQLQMLQLPSQQTQMLQPQRQDILSSDPGNGPLSGMASPSQFQTQQRSPMPTVGNSPIPGKPPTGLSSQSVSGAVDPSSAAVSQQNLQPHQQFSVPRTSPILPGFDSSIIQQNNGFALQRAVSESPLRSGGNTGSLLRGTASRESWNPASGMLQVCNVSQILSLFTSIYEHN